MPISTIQVILDFRVEHDDSDGIWSKNHKVYFVRKK